MPTPPDIPYFEVPEMSEEDLAQRKREVDRAALLTHVDWIQRPPAWVYSEIEEAIEHAIAGRLDAPITSRDGRDYPVAELVERWEIDDEMLELYKRAADDAGYDSGWF